MTAAPTAADGPTRRASAVKRLVVSVVAASLLLLAVGVGEEAYSGSSSCAGPAPFPSNLLFSHGSCGTGHWGPVSKR